MIELTDFSKCYSNNLPAVKNVSLKCEYSKITGLIGENGAGKTTVLRAITARHFATQGTVTVNGINAEDFPETVRNLTGFVQEEPRLPAEYTVAEYLSMTARLHSVSSSRIPEDLVLSLSLADLLPKKIGTLSKGQRERVNFSQALIYNPPVLVLDEPASGLDPAQIVNMRKFILSLKKDHTILLSTHLMQETEALCDYIYILHKGTVVAHGTKETLPKENGCSTLEETFFKLTQGEGK